MKIFKIKLRREKRGKVTYYYYPEKYDANNFTVLAFESIGNGKSVLSRNDGTEYIIAVCSDAKGVDLPKEDFQELSYDEALALGSRWRPQILKIRDTEKVLKVIEKMFKRRAIRVVLRRLGLNEEEINCLDPEHPADGVNKGVSFQEILDRVLRR